MGGCNAVKVVALSPWRELALKAVDASEAHALRGWCRSAVACEFGAEIVILPGGIRYPVACDTGGRSPLIALSSAVVGSALEAPCLLHAAGHIMASRLTVQPLICIDALSNERVERVAWSLGALLSVPPAVVTLAREDRSSIETYAGNYDVTGGMLALRLVLQDMLDRPQLSARTLRPVLAEFPRFLDDFRRRAELLHALATA